MLICRRHYYKQNVSFFGNGPDLTVIKFIDELLFSFCKYSKVIHKTFMEKKIIVILVIICYLKQFFSFPTIFIVEITH